ncbi:MAG: hypothetical protein QM813_17000 [Verrucomicrobiota bacterium]
MYDDPYNEAPLARDGSNQNNLTLTVQGGGLAIALSLVALGAVLSMAIILPQLMEKTAQAAAAPGSVRSQIAEREARVAQDQNAIQSVDIESLKRR